MDEVKAVSFQRLLSPGLDMLKSSFVSMHNGNEEKRQRSGHGQYNYQTDLVHLL